MEFIHHLPTCFPTELSPHFSPDRRHLNFPMPWKTFRPALTVAVISFIPILIISSINRSKNGRTGFGKMKIIEMKVTPCALVDPPLRSAFGLHAPYALRTIIELITDDGLVGLS